MRALWTLTAIDLRQRVRDRSVLVLTVLVPLGLMVVLDLALGGTEDGGPEPTTVAVSAPAGDRTAAALLIALDRAPEVTVEGAGASQVRTMVEVGEADLGLIVPAGLGTADVGGVELVEGAGAGTRAAVVAAVVRGTLDQLVAARGVTTAAGLAGLPPEQADAVARAAGTGQTITLTEGEASDDQLGTAGSLVAGQAGLFLFFATGYGVLGLLAEREQGTAARLRSLPVRWGVVLAAKALVSVVLGVLATGVLLVAGALLFGLSLGSPVAVAALVLCAVAAATSLMVVIGRVARTAEQAGVLQAIAAVVLGLTGGAFFPVGFSGWAGRLLELNPVAALARGLGITAGGGGVGDIGVPVALLVGVGALCLGASRLVPDRVSAP